MNIFPVGEFISEEMNVRGWTMNDLAERMGEDEAVNLCALELIMLAPRKEMILGEEIAHKLGRAFGTSAGLWLQLDKRWREAQE